MHKACMRLERASTQQEVPSEVTSMGCPVGSRKEYPQQIQYCLYCLRLITLYMVGASLFPASMGMDPRTTMDAPFSTMAQGLAQHGSP